MNLGESVTITLAGNDYVLENTLNVRKNICIQVGGLRAVMQNVTALNEWEMAKLVAIASGSKDVDTVFLHILQHGALPTFEQITKWIGSLQSQSSSDEEDQGKPEAATVQ